MTKQIDTTALLPRLNFLSAGAVRNRNLTVEQLAAIRREARAEHKAWKARRAARKAHKA